MEVTPGAEAFPDDNTMEQLELTGQLTDTFESMPEPPEVMEEPSQDQTGADEIPDDTVLERKRSRLWIIRPKRCRRTARTTEEARQGTELTEQVRQETETAERMPRAMEVPETA